MLGCVYTRDGSATKMQANAKVVVLASASRATQNRAGLSLLAQGIEIGKEHAPFVVLVFFSFEHAKNLLIMGPNNTKNSSFKCDFLILNYE